MKNSIKYVLTMVISTGIGIASGLTTQAVYEKMWDKLYFEEKYNFMPTLIASSVTSVAAGMAVAFTLTKIVCKIILFSRKARS